MALPYPVSPDPYSAGWQGAQTLGNAGQATDDPSQPIGAYYYQMSRWKVMRAVIDGNHYLKSIAREYIPQLPNEDDACYQRRLDSTLFSPFTGRIIDGAIGLILRKPIVLEGGNEQWWEEWSKNVDRQGTDLQEFARKLLRTSIGYGHSAVLVDYPRADGIRTLADERAANLKPYLSSVDPWDILGWRFNVQEKGGQLQQVRISEMVTQPDGEFGEKVIEQIRVLEPGSYRLFQREGKSDWMEVESGNTSLTTIPLVPTYSEKEATLVSRPPLLDVGYINLKHYGLQSQHLNALQVAGFPLLVLKGWDEQSSKLQVDVSKALAMPPDGDVSYVEPANKAFDAYAAELSELERQMSNLGIAILAQQKMVAEAAKKAQLDRADTNSMLANISQDLEDCLQEAVNLAAEYAGQEPPTVGISRDFDIQKLDSAEMGGIVQLFNAGIIDQQTALELLHRGEVLNDAADIEEIMSRAESDELAGIEMQVKRTEAMAEIGEGTPPNEEDEQPGD